jgi:hypothetical protein
MLFALAPGLAAAQAKKAAPAARPAKPAAPAAGATPPGDNDPDPPIQRTVIHTEAYKKREYLGPHINFKVTPPEERGVQGRVLVEVYNYSKTYLNVVDFWLYLSNNWGDKIEVHITCDDIKPNWSALRWVRIPGAKKVPKMDKVVIQNLSIFDENGKKIKLKHYTDLIKK